MLNLIETKLMEYRKKGYLFLVKMFVFALIISFASCGSSEEDPIEPENVEELVEEEEEEEEKEKGDSEGEENLIFPFDIGLDSWKITLPRNFSNREKDGALVADEVFLDASRNHYSEDPSFTVYDDEYFFLTEDGYARFECPATDDIPTTSLNTTNTRTELREMPSDGSGEAGWDATTSSVKTMELRVRVIQTPESKRFAFAQIHDFGQPIWDDLIRVQVESDERNATVGDPGIIFIMGDMVEGELEDGFEVDFRERNRADRVIKTDYVLGDWLHLKITVQNSTIRIFLEDMENPVRVYEDATCLSNYFRAGVYNQSIRNNYGGVGIAEFSSITVSENF